MTYEESDRLLLPMRDAVEIIKGKWKIPIILMLNRRGMRYKELILTVSGISSKVLSRELQDLERNRLIGKKIISKLPLTQEYYLTSHGRSLVPLIEEIRKWGQLHRNVIIG
ncbi:MAG: helix-turn-helix domain-containing protein [Bacteroidota bacterium]